MNPTSPADFEEGLAENDLLDPEQPRSLLPQLFSRNDP